MIGKKILTTQHTVWKPGYTYFIPAAKIGTFD
jgi:hypothetical protein